MGLWIPNRHACPVLPVVGEHGQRLGAIGSDGKIGTTLDDHDILEDPERQAARHVESLPCLRRSRRGNIGHDHAVHRRVLGAGRRLRYRCRLVRPHDRSIEGGIRPSMDRTRGRRTRGRCRRGRCRRIRMARRRGKDVLPVDGGVERWVGPGYGATRPCEHRRRPDA